MKKIRYTKMAMALAAVCCLAACQNEDTMSGTGSLRVSAFAYEGEVVSRAYTDFSNVFGATDANPLVMPLWARMGDAIFDETASYNGTSWSTACRLEPGVYDFYSYLPQSIENEGMTVAFDKSTDPVTITFSGVPVVSDTDILLSASTPSGESGHGDAGTDAVVNPYDQKIDNSDGQIVTFRMDHVLAKLSFSFSNPTGKAFTDLRQIVIREVRVHTYWAPLWTIVCSMNKTAPVSYEYTDDWGASPVIHSIRNTTDVTMGGTTVQGYLVEQKAYSESASEVFGSCYVVPQPSGNSIHIKAIYDVYDQYGVLIRDNEQVINSALVVVPETSPGVYAPIEAGKEYKVDVKIIPDYLFVLGDDDAGNSLQIGM